MIVLLEVSLFFSGLWGGLGDFWPGNSFRITEKLRLDRIPGGHVAQSKVVFKVEIGFSEACPSEF